MKIQLSVLSLLALPLNLLLIGCENKEAPGQLTVVEGRVLRQSDKVPFAGVPMAIEPYYGSFHGPSFTAAVKTTRTDADGYYTLSFYNEKGAYYAVSCDPDYTDRRLDFLPWGTTGPAAPTVGGDLRRRQIVLGQKNVVDFQPDQRAVILLRVQLRSSRFQQLVIGAGMKLRTNSLDTVIWRSSHWGGWKSESATLRRLGGNGQTIQDSTVNLYSLPVIASDTVRATFRFVQ
ncbi:hypothetical protein JAO73_09730 [Hymenobacter sp. BT523]|uniref:hypothetical protein n=1 Tax=Hymenobacter sp. BT523 TaxID=2795725 RepID=UPI0018EB4AFB|nr:hypothetical protein [Hymenobacter sp. BT523]MBJ6109292.1 hypothetical protein [Hymenobacter sp. BT523]